MDQGIPREEPEAMGSLFIKQKNEGEYKMKKKLLARLLLCSMVVSLGSSMPLYAEETEMDKAAEEAVVEIQEMEQDAPTEAPAEEVEIVEEIPAEVTYYNISYSYDEAKGSIIGKKSVDLNEDVDMQISPAKHYRIQSVNYMNASEGIAREIAVDSYGYGTIPASEVNEDITVEVVFERIESYTITSGNIAQGHMCALCTANASAHQEVIDNKNCSVVSGSAAVFVLYSQNWSSCDEWYLTDIQINDETVNTPRTYNKGDNINTVMKNGSVVNVRLEDIKTKDPHAEKTARYRYIVTISEAQGDMVVDANFKKNGRREFIFKDLDGIAKTAASTENRYYKAIKKIGYHYDYSLTANASQIYKTYNEGSDKSRNIYAYTLKPGYNPDSVSIRMFYDGIEREDMITKYGVGSKLIDISDGYKTSFRHFEGFVANFYTQGFEYGFALKQHSAHNQMCYINADPYQYSFAYQLNGGAFAEGDMDTARYALDESQEVLCDTNTYTIENDESAINMPMERPVKEGYEFRGWQLVNGNGIILDSGKQFILNASSIGFADANQDLYFEAVWSPAI